MESRARRGRARAAMTTTVNLAPLLARISAEYRALPGLRLTEPQMRRLWDLDAATCATALAALVEGHLLVRTADARYASSAPARTS